MSEPVVLTIINPVEGKRYRVSLRGDISRLSVRKLKRHLAPSTQIAPEEQQLKYGGIELTDDVLCAEVGIAHGSTVTVERVGANQASLFSPRKEALEMETLEQQRAMLQQERLTRDDEFRRQQELLARSISQAESKRLELVREKQDRELELNRLQEMEELAEQERRRLAEVRKMEGEREAARARDLEARKEQLARERNMQKQLEITKLENERKKMLLQQQRSELEAERARLDREVRDRIQRQREAEMRIREREVELERVAIDGERARREIDLERAVLRQTREAEVALMNAERDAESRRLTLLQQQASSAAAGVVGGGAGASVPRSPADSYGGVAGLNSASANRNAAAASQNSSFASGAGSGSLAGGGAPFGASSVPQGQSQGLANIEARLMEMERMQRGGGSVNIPRGSSPARAEETQAAPLTQPQLRRIAQANLDVLAEHLGVGELALDDNHTCVVSVDDKYTLLITVDIATQRLYLYSTLSTTVPKHPNTKLKLYEFLLEGALLGRDMCGGGVGLSLKNDFVLMSTSIFLPLAAPTALRAVTPRFVEALVMWRQRVHEILAESGEAADSVVSGSTVPQQQHHHHQHPRTAAAGLAAGVPAERPVVGIEVTEQVDTSPSAVRSGSHHSSAAVGVLVVAAKGPAARGGILAGDMIRAVNGLPTPDLDEFQRAVQMLRPNSSAHFMVNRLGADLSLTVLVGSAPM